jgi:hypothetical protein
MSLGRYSKALEHLVAAGPSHFEASLKLAKDKGLLRQLLALTQQQQQQEVSTEQQQQQQQQQGVLGTRQRLVAVLGAYGDALLAGRKAEDAAVAYSAAGLMDKALTAYRYVCGGVGGWGWTCYEIDAKSISRPQRSPHPSLAIPFHHAPTPTLPHTPSCPPVVLLL